MPDVLLEKRPNGVGLITLNRPESLNAFGGTLVRDFHEAFAYCNADPAVRCIAVTGAGRGFSSGGDVRGMRSAAAGEEAGQARPAQGVEEAIIGFKSFQDTLVLPIHLSRKPAVALVNGPAAGGGFGLVLAFDFRICSDRARFVSAFANVGQSGDCGVAYGLERLVGRARALEIMFLSDSISAEQALGLGIANRVVPHDELMTAGMEFCARLAAGPTAVYARMKENLTFAETHTYKELLDQEALNWKLSQLGEDHRNAVNAFLEGRRPSFVGR